MGSQYILSFKEKPVTEEDGKEQQAQSLNGARKWGIGSNGRLILQIIAVGLLLLVYSRSTFSLGESSQSATFDSGSAAPIGPPRSPAYEVKAYRGVVAADNELCSKIGVDVLKKGGNAVDAAIGTMFCQGVVAMYSSGLGAGGFMVVRIPPSQRRDSDSEGAMNTTSESEVWTLNFRETAPALSNRTMFKDKPGASLWGGLAVAVPGELRGLQEAHRRWGTIPWKELIEPSIKLATGWRVQKELARRISLFPSVMLNHPDWKPLFAPNGVLVKEGDWVNRTNYARTLSIIAEQGPDAFYEGPIADSVVEKVRQSGGILSHEDLKNYRIRVEKPLVGTYRGRKVYTIHAPGSGILLLQMLNVLGHYDMSERTPTNIHRFIEAMKFAFASRTKISDPMTNADIVRMSKLATPEYALEILRNITDDTTHPPEYYHPEFDVPTSHGTCYMSVVDQNRMAVSLTSSANTHFGSFVLDPTTGVILNDQMDDFSVPDVPNSYGLYPSPYNYPEPGKIPASSISPAILENPDGSFYASIGASGGSRITTALVQVLLNLDWGFHVSDAVEFGRVHDQLYPLMLEVDEIYPPKFVEYLRSVGHNVTLSDIGRIAANVQAVIERDGILYGASDSRKNGVAVGY